MLQALNGRMHSVITGFSILDTGTVRWFQVGGNQGSHEETDAEGDRRLRPTKEPLGKAGATPSRAGAVLWTGSRETTPTSSACP